MVRRLTKTPNDTPAQLKEIAGMARSSELADHFFAAHEEFFEFVKGASPEQWRVRGINHPKIRVGNEDEGRPVGVIVHHVAFGYLNNRLRCEAWIKGEDLEPPGPETNRRHAADHPDPDQVETLRFLEGEATALHGFIGALSDSELAAGGTFINGSTTVEDLIGRRLPFHIRWHLGSIQATWAAMEPGIAVSTYRRARRVS